jgi:hypothetical protein
VVKAHCTGEALRIRYADDFVCAFRYSHDAERFYWVLPKRRKKFGLEVAPEKTRILRCSRFHSSRKRRFTFLGFERYWFDRQGLPRVMRRTAPKKLQGACRRSKEWIRANRHLKGRHFSRVDGGAVPGVLGALRVPGRTPFGRAWFRRVRRGRVELAAPAGALRAPASTQRCSGRRKRRRAFPAAWVPAPLSLAISGLQAGVQTSAPKGGVSDLRGKG